MEAAVDRVRDEADAERLVGEQVADTGECGLVEQARLDRRGRPRG